jgi:hypothetical protein
MQLDAEDDADVFYKPPVIPLAGSTNDDPPRLSGETQVETGTAGADEQDD